MLLHKIIRSLKSITQPPEAPSTSPKASAEAPETVEASGCSSPIARAQAPAPTPAADSPADHHHHARRTSADSYASSTPHETAAAPGASREASSARLHPPSPNLQHQTPVYEPQPDPVPEKHLEIRQLDLSTSSIGPGPDPEPETDTSPDSPAPSPSPSPILTPVEATPSDDELEIMQRKIWVKRPGASATLVTVSHDDLVDTVRDMILRKYANSLGRSIDSPDITLKIVSREPANNHVPVDRLLGPDEAIGQTLDSYYPGGQTIEEALLIDVPQRRTPKPSPRIGNHHPAIAYPYYVEDHRPGDGAREYFPPMAVHSPHLAAHPPHLPHLPHLPQQNGAHLPHSIGILQTGQVAPLPSPGGTNTRRHRDGRPKYVRQHTSSPTIMHSSQPHSNGKTGTTSS